MQRVWVIFDAACIYVVYSDEAGSSANVLLEMAHRSRVVELLILHVQVCTGLTLCPSVRLSVCLSVCLSVSLSVTVVFIVECN